MRYCAFPARPIARELEGARLIMSQMSLSIRMACSTLATALVTLLAASPAYTQQTQEATSQQQREEKARNLHGYARNKMEAVLHRIEDRLLIQRLLDPPNGLFLRLGGFTEGGGFGGGPAFRISNPRGTGLTVSAAGSLKGYWIAEGTFAPADETVSTFALLGVQNWLLTWYRPDGRLAISQLADRFADLFLDGLRPRVSP